MNAPSNIIPMNRGSFVEELRAASVAKRRREGLDVSAGLDGCVLRLNGEVITSGTLTHCARVSGVVQEALNASRSQKCGDAQGRCHQPHNHLHKDEA